MKKFLIYLLITGYSLSNAPAVELLKTPFIGIHYLEHLSINPSLSFQEFLSMHYLGKDIKDNDTDRDMKLPFKKMIHTHSHVLFQNPYVARLPKHTVQLTAKLSFLYQSTLRHALLDQPFRPPQFI